MTHCFHCHLVLFHLNGLELAAPWLLITCCRLFCFVLFFNLNQPQKQFSPFSVTPWLTTYSNLISHGPYPINSRPAWAAVVSQVARPQGVKTTSHSLSTLLPKCCCRLNSKSSSPSFFLLSSLVYSLLQVLSTQDFNHCPFENDIEISALRPNLAPKFQTHIVVSWTISLKIFKIWIIFQMARFANAFVDDSVSKPVSC